MRNGAPTSECFAHFSPAPACVASRFPLKDTSVSWLSLFRHFAAVGAISTTRGFPPTSLHVMPTLQYAMLARPRTITDSSRDSATHRPNADCPCTYGFGARRSTWCLGRSNPPDSGTAIGGIEHRAHQRCSHQRIGVAETTQTRSTVPPRMRSHHYARVDNPLEANQGGYHAIGID
jgi:hypothetical protein